MWCCNWTKNEVDTLVVREKVHGSSNEKSASDLGDGVLLGSSVGVVLGWLVGVLALFFVIEHITHTHTHVQSHAHGGAIAKTRRVPTTCFPYSTPISTGYFFYAAFV